MRSFIRWPVPACSLPSSGAGPAFQEQARVQHGFRPKHSLGGGCADGKTRQRSSASLGPGLPGPGGHGCRLAAPEAGLLPQQDRAEPSGRDETLSTWGQAFIFAPANLVTTPHPPMHGSPKCFSHESVEELYFHRQHLQLYLVLSLSGRKWSATPVLLQLQWWGNSLPHSLHSFFGQL